MSRLRLTDNGTGQPFGLAVRVGNGSRLVPRQPVRVAFYQGDPQAGGRLLGELTVADLPAPGWRDLRLDGLTLSGSGDLYALVDPADSVPECNEGNNRIAVAHDRVPAQGALTLAPDAPTYGPGSPVYLVTRVTNPGSYANGYRVELRIEDGAGAAVATLNPPPIATLAPGALATLGTDWNSGALLTGDYVVRALLYDTAGNWLAEATGGFALVPDAGPLAELALSIAQPSYHTSDRVEMLALARNLSSNVLLVGTRIALDLIGPGGEPLGQREQALGDLSPGALRQGLVVQDLVRAPEGAYTVRASLYDAGGTRLAEAQGGFTVREDLARTLTASLAVAAPQVPAGTPQVCTETLRHSGTQAATLSLRHLLIDLDSGADAPLAEVPETLAIDPGAQRTWERTLATAALAPGDYACALQVRLGDTWTTLGYAAFAVTAPVVRLDATLDLGDGVRLLVLLDAPEGCDHEDAGHDDDGPCPDPEREALATLLEAAGWDYTLTTDADAFTRGLRSGGYGVYLVHSAKVKLPEQVQDELVEAIYNGAGLVVGGDHDRRNQRLELALGIEHKGQGPQAQGVELTAGAPFTPGRLAFEQDGNAHEVRLTGAQALGTYLDTRGRSTARPALAHYRYGDGTSVGLGFDALAEAAGDPKGPFAELLGAALAQVRPQAQAAAPGATLPIVVTLANRGGPTAGRVLLDLPDGVAVVDPMDARLEPPQTLVWAFDLALDQTATFPAWLRLPEAEAPLTFEALIQTGQALDFRDARALSLTLDPQHPPGLAAARLAMADERAFKAPLKDLDKAAAHLADGDNDQALAVLVKAARALRTIAHPAAAQIRHWIDNAIAEVARQGVQTQSSQSQSSQTGSAP